MQNSSDMID